MQPRTFNSSVVRIARYLARMVLHALASAPPRPGHPEAVIHFIETKSGRDEVYSPGRSTHRRDRSRESRTA